MKVAAWPVGAARGTDHPYYILGLLFVAYTFSFVDRQILSILFEPIRLELGLSDTQLGFLGGLAFALFYATLGVPIALLADRGNRKRIITASLVVFSFMTAVCGMAQNFLQLALARVGVGIGEAGVNPASHSIIADVFPPERRSTAMGVMAVGANFGMLLGFVVGGTVAALYGWRAALMTVGLPGLLLAVVFWLTLREPERGRSELRQATAPAPPLTTTLRYMWRNKAMRHLVLGSMVAGISGYGVSAWLPSFFIRSHGLNTAEVGVLLALMGGVLGGIGAFLGGYFNDRLSVRRPGAGLAAIAVIEVAIFPLAVAMYLVADFWLAVALFVIPAFAGNMFLAPSLALIQSLARLRMRAVAAAVKMLAINLVGLGLGPQAVGILSDVLNPYLGNDSLRVAIALISSLGLWSAVHFYLSSKHLEAGLEDARQEP